MYMYIYIYIYVYVTLYIYIYIYIYIRSHFGSSLFEPAALPFPCVWRWTQLLV